MTKNISVKMHKWSDGEKPENGTMIMGEQGGEWHILMYDGDDNTAFQWEDDWDHIIFDRWFYLGDLSPKNGTR